MHEIVTCPDESVTTKRNEKTLNTPCGKKQNRRDHRNVPVQSRSVIDGFIGRIGMLRGAVINRV